ncbi:MAG: isoprenylcysteine carboxylmethyltransferase family protein [archaeon]|nr:isoprenylcysteine carboxylmethyltransferase family protein [archaeon]
MIQYINVVIMLLSYISMFFLYIISIQPIKYREKWGNESEKKCLVIRTISGIFWLFIFITYILYLFYPIDGIPHNYPWSYFITLTISIFLLIPSIWLITIAFKDAGAETAKPNATQEIFGGIYEKIRHPQYTAEIVIWILLGMILNSIFLTIISFLWIPIFIIWIKFEEKDLILRFGNKYEERQKTTGMLIPKDLLKKQK